MDKISISLNEVRELSNEIRRLNNNILDVLNRTRQEMNALQAVWQSSSSDMIRLRYNHFAKKFDEQKETISSYANFLDHTAASYESLESTITNNASNMQ